MKTKLLTWMEANDKEMFQNYRLKLALSPKTQKEVLARCAVKSVLSGYDWTEERLNERVDEIIKNVDYMVFDEEEDKEAIIEEGYQYYEGDIDEDKYEDETEDDFYYRIGVDYIENNPWVEYVRELEVFVWIADKDKL